MTLSSDVKTSSFPKPIKKIGDKLPSCKNIIVITRLIFEIDAGEENMPHQTKILKVGASFKMAKPL